MNELHQLIALMLEDQLSTTDAERLESLLANDPEARRIYAEQCQLHARLSMDESLQASLKAKPLIELDESGNAEADKRSNSILNRFPSYAGIVAASAAISFTGVLTVLNFSSETTPQNPAETTTALLSPQEVYEQADFPESGNLKRPPHEFRDDRIERQRKNDQFQSRYSPDFFRKLLQLPRPGRQLAGSRTSS